MVHLIHVFLHACGLTMRSSRCLHLLASFVFFFQYFLFLYEPNPDVCVQLLVGVGVAAGSCAHTHTRTHAHTHTHTAGRVGTQAEARLDGIVYVSVKRDLLLCQKRPTTVSTA